MTAERWYECITRSMNIVAGLMILSIFIVVFGDVIARNVFNVSIFSASELSIFLLVYASFISAAYAIPKRLHFILFDFRSKLSDNLHIALTIVVDLIVVIFTTLVGFYGFKLGMSQMGQMIAALKIPYGYMYMALPLFSALVLITMGLRYMAFGLNEEPHVKAEEVVSK